MCARGPSLGSCRGDRVIRGEGVSPTYPPPQGLRLAGPGPCPTAPTLARGRPRRLVRPCPSRAPLWDTLAGRPRTRASRGARGAPPPWAYKTIPFDGGTGLLGCPAGTLFVTRWDSAESACPVFFPPLCRPRAPPTGGAYRTSLGPRLAGSDGVGRCGPRYSRHGGRQSERCSW